MSPSFNKLCFIAKTCIWILQTKYFSPPSFLPENINLLTTQSMWSGGTTRLTTVIQPIKHQIKHKILPIFAPPSLYSTQRGDEGWMCSFSGNSSQMLSLQQKYYPVYHHASRHTARKILGVLEDNLVLTNTRWNINHFSPMFTTQFCSISSLIRSRLWTQAETLLLTVMPVMYN